MAFKKGALLGVVAVLLVATTAQSITVVNASFEEPVVTGGNFQSFFAGDAFPGWSIGGNGAEVFGAGRGLASDGVQSLDLNRLAAGSISQTLSGFSVGRSYRVRFDVTGAPVSAPSQGPATRVFDASIDGTTETFSVTPVGERFEMRSFLFTASAPSATLSFAAVTGGSRGAILDDIEISAVPLPASALLLGGALGLLGLRRRLGG
ncbi:MAG: hypothetical protein ACFBWO_03650 [Paracoccaceae bacterium]